MAFLTKEQKKQALEYMKGNLTGLSFSSVDKDYIDNKIQGFKESVDKQIDLVSQNVSDLIFVHGNATLSNAEALIYANGNATVKIVNSTITEYANAKAAEVMETISEELDFNQEQINLMRDFITSNAVRGGKVCPLMDSLQAVVNLKHDAHLAGCAQPANSFPVYEKLNSQDGIVAYLADTVACVGEVGDFMFANSSGQCWVDEGI